MIIYNLHPLLAVLGSPFLDQIGSTKMQKLERPFYRLSLVHIPEEEWQRSLTWSLEEARKLSARPNIRELAGELLAELAMQDECRHVVTITREFGFDTQYLIDELKKEFNEVEISFPAAGKVTLTVDARGAMPYAEKNVAKTVDKALDKAECNYIRATSPNSEVAYMRIRAMIATRQCQLL